MSSASPSPAQRRRRVLLRGALGLAAGAAAQWVLVKQDGRAAGGDASPASAKTSAVQEAPAIPAVSPESLRTQTRSGRLTSLAEALPDMGVNDILPLVEVLAAARPEPAPRPDRMVDAMLRMLFARWVELDAPGMITALEKPPFEYAQGVRGLAVLAWAEAQGVTALEAVRWKWPALARSGAMFLLRRRPELADSLIGFLTASTEDGEDALSTYAGDFMDAEDLLGPERSLSLAAAAGDKKMLERAARYLEEQDFARAFQLAKELPNGPMRDIALTGFLRGLNPPFDDWEGRESLSFTVEYEALPADSRLREKFLHDYAREKGEQNRPAALEWARKLSAAKQRSEALEHIAGWMAQDDAEGATKVFAEAWIADPSTHECEFSAANNYGHYTGSWFGLREIVSSFDDWHEKDPATAEAWFQTLTNTELRAELAIGASLPSRSLAMTPSSEYRLIGAMDLISSGIPTREARPQEVPAELRRTAELFSVTVWGVSDEEWKDATADEHRFLSTSAMESRTKEDPAAALEFFNSIPPEERSLGAWYQAGAAYLKEDAEEASVWMKSLPPGPQRDAAATALVENLSAAGENHDLEAAFAWAASMSGQAERERYLIQTARKWGKQDFDAARAAVGTSSLTEYEKQHVLSQLPKAVPPQEGGAR